MTTVSDEGIQFVAPAPVVLVTVTGPDPDDPDKTLTDQVPLDAALALEAQKTGWARDHVATIAQLNAEKAALQARIDELEAATPDTPKGRKAVTDTPKADEANPAAEAATDTPKEG